jgi:hypothetical protein
MGEADRRAIFGGLRLQRMLAAPKLNQFMRQMRVVTGVAYTTLCNYRACLRDAISIPIALCSIGWIRTSLSIRIQDISITG